ncbi:MAG: DUF2231 domain-containing protein [Anaerolineales bacterium]|nr:DUF2231 domain-containing protein [Anaerolineales bacterium]
MTPLDHFHPAVVHFPIALLLTGSVVALVQLYRSGPLDLRVTAWVLLAVGGLGAIGAVVTGLFAQSALPPDAPYRSTLNWHIGPGLLQLVIYGGLLYWGWLYRGYANARRAAAGRTEIDLLDDRRARPWVTLLLLLGMAAVALTGWNGGLLVYQWAVNVG